MTKTFFLGVLTAGLLVPGMVWAQAVQVRVEAGDGIEVKDVAVEAQKTPNFQPGDVKTKPVKNPREWLEIEVEFEPKKVLPRDAVIPELLFRYYAAIKNSEGSVTVLKGEVTHVNILDGEETFSAVYVSPSTLGKITGDYRRFQTSAVEGVGIEIFHNGILVGGYSSTGGKFWEDPRYAPQAGIRGKDKTPFAWLWLDRYADFKESGP